MQEDAINYKNGVLLLNSNVEFGHIIQAQATEATLLGQIAAATVNIDDTVSIPHVKRIFAFPVQIHSGRVANNG